MARESLAVQYRPKTFSDVVEQDAIKQILTEELKSGSLKRCLLFTGPAGCGKAQPLYSKILTPNGWTTMGDIKLDDVVFTAKGNLAKVIAIYPQGMREIYEICLSDKSKIRVADNHLNCIYTKQENQKVEEVITTLELIQRFQKKECLYVDRCFVASELAKLYEERIISKITYIGHQDCQCIMLDHEDHTYISDDFIPTHNTTDARIFAKEIESNVTNIIEINCADHTGVEDIRTLIIDDSKVKPLVGKYKIYILDEVHMLTVQSQNALLKILEEPPAFCVYIMCTTDPQKILSTILSRAFRYDFQLISHQGIINRLNYILTQEQVKPDSIVNSWNIDALGYIATASKGHMRDAITTLDKVLSYSKDVTCEAVEKVLGVTSYELLFQILDSILNRNDGALLQILEQITQSGMDLKLFVKNFLQFVLDVNKYVIFKTEVQKVNFSLLTLPPSYEQRLSVYTAAHRPALKSLLHTLLELNSLIRWETNIKPVLESNLLLEVLK